MRIWPSGADVSSCTSSSGTTYPTSGEGSAHWFNWGGCASWYTFEIPQGETVRLKIYTDSCAGCVCYHPDFDIYEFIGGSWVLEGTYDLPDVKGTTEYLYKSFDSNQIKVQTNNCFYIKIHGETTYTCGDGFCELDEIGSCYDDCGKLAIYTPTPEATVGEDVTFQVVHSADREPRVKITTPEGVIT
jgi:hypothetical protein